MIEKLLIDAGFGCGTVKKLQCCYFGRAKEQTIRKDGIF